MKIHHSFGDPAKAFDFWALFERPKAAHVYCCGPQSLMDTVQDMTGHWPSGTVHFESFGAGNANTKENTPFTVQLKRTGTSWKFRATARFWTFCVPRTCAWQAPAKAVPAAPAG